MAALQIRAAGPDDVPALAALARSTWTDAFGKTVSPEDHALELEEKRSKPYFRDALLRDSILVAASDAGLAGYVQFGDVRIPEVEAGPDDRELRRIYVAAELQGAGVGRKLMTAALGHPRLAGAARVFLQVWEQSAAAIAFYESLGFRIVGRTTFRIGGDTAVDLVMVRVSG